MENNKNGIVGAIIIAGVLIAGAILLKGNSPQEIRDPNARKLSQSVAKIIGLDQKAFKACLASGKYTGKVQSDIDDGIKAGVNGTPGSFIVKNGKVVDVIVGAQPIENITQLIKQINESNEEPTPIAQIRPITTEDHILGNINAKIIIVEYSDMECPFCKVFHNTMHQIVANSSGEVAWVYRHYPIPQLHPKAFREAEATECAWEQGGNETFWKYIDKVYEITPSNNKLEESEL